MEIHAVTKRGQRWQGQMAEELMDEHKPVVSRVDEWATWPKTVGFEKQVKVAVPTKRARTVRVNSPFLLSQPPLRQSVW